ncbi:polysaccharide deacetylase family protein [Dactylosporangium vinaceum]|uniref:Polysaccharide deacetylase family protein n=1 Tax=Dactylosporangium vinaceum TaxID=53362 RepID=A0ABV5M774_9ACTN|nr:polysaccharide deacetylase family protein [Dactylosporangium vinaceum]UAB92849.1 polysaccharide deacetylase family protein [Dactylosporangium vinaceum]
MGLSRRRILGGAGLAVAGMAVGAVGSPLVQHVFGLDEPPLAGGYASAADVLTDADSPSTTITYHVRTDAPVVAFTFDDGPAPDWTPMVLDALDAWDVPATFFMVGRNLSHHADVVRGRLDRHEVGNHTWSHADLATLDLSQAVGEINRGAEAIHNVTGRAPTLLRPPYGHLGGSTVLAADKLGYRLVLWSQQMHEAQYEKNPQGQVADIVNTVRPGSIVLAHDVGDQRRLVALRHLGEMFAGLRARGYRFVTVSELLALDEHDPAQRP